ncbi:ammonia-forming cytochrome c nitrite reductase subunit c552 [Polyangium spumosum]|uniref:nitrite reductase (cytochrome; ammonia-forming) n=1 Tax=Polyangium spumosum TaxID=889282 RepID=A0A6N7PNF5_9BACT|nr:ammonia-forming cytochrome c nitrite reductase subunit c552 [Polyangium spumosum]MRG92336.1 ammonia-forming cytochrome c nitrite reductase subunit c552 [Polyangium spumosum]
MDDKERSTPPPSARRRAVKYLIAIAALSGVTIFALAALVVTMYERKDEAKTPYVRLVEVGETTTDPVQWGKNWPRQFDSYQRTVDATHTQYGGSEGSIPESRLEADPWLKRMFAGYAFALDFRERRGHAYMLYDQEQTKRITERPQPGACLHCHASVVPTWRRVGLEAVGKALPDAQGFDWPAVMRGFEKMSTIPYQEAHAELLRTPDGTPAGAPLAEQAGEAHPVSCVDCHDPETMALRVTRPGFVRGIQSLAQSDAPTPHLPSIERWRKGDRKSPYDPNVDATRQEMRSFACAQCHVEYYCGPKTTLFFPWSKGLRAEDIEAHYDETRFPDGKPFMDFVHAETGAPIYKAQHPEFETWSQGVHARSGVSCADCHMPYKREGATKVSDHWVRSPLLNVSRACQTCHPHPEDELLARVKTTQDRTHALMGRAGKALTDMLDAIKAAKAAGATDEALKPVLDLQRKAQWRLDFVNAENSMGFHADQETARLLGESIDDCRKAHVQALGIVAQGNAPPPAAPPPAAPAP